MHQEDGTRTAATSDQPGIAMGLVSEAIDHLAAAICEMSSAATLSAVVDIVKRAARHLVLADGATFVLREGANCHYVDEDAIEPLWKGRRFPLAACVSGWSMEYRQQAIVPDIYADPRIPADAYRPTFVQSLVMTPVGTAEPWAAIGVYWARRFTPTPEQARCLQALADSTALAMENIRIRTHLDHGSSLGADGTPKVGEPVILCAWTRRILSHGSWISIEQFLQQRFGMAVTHGISDEAAQSFGAAQDGGPGGGRRTTS